MINYLKDIAILGNDNRRKAIENILNSIGVSYNIVGTISKNIVVSINPTNEKFVIGAHYDAFYYGANDNGAACVILLNLINDLKNSKTSIEFVFFDKEEEGMIGSEEYINLIGKDNIKGMINLDMCGLGSNIVITYDKCKQSVFSIDCMNQIIKDENINFIRRLPYGDYNNFIDAKIPSIFIVNSTDNDLNWYFGKTDYNYHPDFSKTMHKKTDTYDSIDESGMIMIYTFLKSYLV